MKAILLKEPGRFEQIAIDEPNKPGPGEALVRVHRVGICGTDISGYLGKMPFYSYPRIPGHELGVEVLEVGADVANVQPGDRCSVEPYMNCQTLLRLPPRRPATAARTCRCSASTPTAACGRASSCRPASCTRRSKLTLDQLALVETLGIGCHAVNRGAPQAGEHVLVIGAGPIGLSVIEFVKLTGGDDHRPRPEPATARFLQAADGRPPHRALRRRGSESGGAEGAHRRRPLPGRLRRDRQPEVDVQRLQLRRPHRPAGLRRHRDRRHPLSATRCSTAGK